MRNRHLLLGLCVSLAIATHGWCAEKLTNLSGEETTAQLSGISEAGELQGTGLAAGLTLDGLRRIARDLPAAAASKPTVVLDLVGGGKVLASSVTAASEKFTIKWPAGEDLVLPIDAVRAIRFKPEAKDDNFEAALAKPSPDNDRLFVEIDGKPAMLVGLVESLEADKVVFQYDGAQQTLPTEKLFGIVVAQATAAPAATSGVLVELADGSRIAGTVQSLAAGNLALTVGASSQVTVPWEAVRSLTIRSSRLAFLSDLEPARVVERRLVTLPGAWQRDRNVQGKTLQLGERKFEKGIGTHAYSELAFTLNGDFDRFAAFIGLDAAAERKGDCVFVILGDGRELLRQRVRGTDQPQEVGVDIAGVKELTLIVEPGEDLDLADLADWADARVIRLK